MAQSSLASLPLVESVNTWGRQSADVALLVGRILVASVFLLTALGGNPTSAYLASIHYPAAGFWSVVAIVVEWIISISLILGVATRAGALLALVYVIVAIVTAHTYWTYPAQQQALQYVFFTKDLAILGGVLVLFATGAGRYRLDAKWLKE